MPALNISGKYDAVAVVLARPKNTIGGRLSLDGLMLAGMPNPKVVTMQIVHTATEIAFIYKDDAGNVILNDRVSSADGLQTTGQSVTFKRVFRTTNEAGRVTAEDTYSFVKDSAGDLQLEVSFSTVAGLLFRSRSQDRGSYRFRALR